MKKPYVFGLEKLDTTKNKGIRIPFTRIFITFDYPSVFSDGDYCEPYNIIENKLFYTVEAWW